MTNTEKVSYNIHYSLRVQECRCEFDMFAATTNGFIFSNDRFIDGIYGSTLDLA